MGYRVKQRLAAHGVRALVVPEVPTLFVNCGASFEDLDNDEKLVEFQVHQLLTQLHLEDAVRSVGQLSGEPVVLLLDRGTLDGAAYVTPEQWTTVLRRAGVPDGDVALHRYHCVIHQRRMDVASKRAHHR